jgi:Resolvase, N terminal domain
MKFASPPRQRALFVWRRVGGSVRVALYARVSTLNDQHPEMQLSELREYGARRGWQIIAEYVDQGISGSRERRRWGATSGRDPRDQPTSDNGDHDRRSPRRPEEPAQDIAEAADPAEAFQSGAGIAAAEPASAAC